MRLLPLSEVTKQALLSMKEAQKRQFDKTKLYRSRTRATSNRGRMVRS